MKRLTLLSGLALGLAGTTAFAGGHLDGFKFTGTPASDFGYAGEVVEAVPIFWDERCASVEYTLNTVLPNAGTATEIPIGTVQAELQEAMDQWNDIRSSFIEMNITDVRATGNPVRRFDFVNELTFSTAASFTALASSPSVTLQQDLDLPANVDIDGDGDADTYDPDAAGLDVCTDIDGDGDIEFPAGFYKAGTIFDNDVQFNRTVSWETNASTPSADIRAIAVHEFGHSHGLSHSLLNKISDRDGTGSTMFPFIDTDDPDSEKGGRSLHDDDIAWSSLTYPEGGSGRLSKARRGDVPFNRAFGLIEGSVESDGQPIAGANVYAQSLVRGAIPAEAFSGKATFVYIPQFGGTYYREFESDAVVNGDYRLPVPTGIYELYLQSPDVGGATGSNISNTAAAGGFFGQHGFEEEGLTPGRWEAAYENAPGLSDLRLVLPGSKWRNADFEVNDAIQLQSFGTIDFGGTGAVLGLTDVAYAARFSNAEMLIALEAGAVPTTALFQMTVFDASLVAEVKRASLALGRLNADGSIAEIDLAKPLQVKRDFVVQDGDLHPYYFHGTPGLGRKLLRKLQKDPTLDVFVVVETPNDADAGHNGVPPLLALDVEGPFGDSFLSFGGGPFQVQTTRNWAIQLNLTP